MTNPPKAENLQADPQIPSGHASYPYVRPIDGGYFMDARHEGEAPGAALLARRDAQEQRRRLEPEIETLAQFFIGLGHAMQKDARCVVFDKESWDGRFTANFFVDAGKLDAERLRNLLTTLRNQWIREMDADRTLAPFEQK